MKRIILTFLALLSCIVIWAAEPLSLNPFYHPEEYSVKSFTDFECVTGDLATPSELKDKADILLGTFMSSNAFLGVSTGLYKHGCGTYVAASGYSSKHDLTAFKTSTISRIASITKPMTALAIMQLYEQGRLDLDVAIQQYLPDFPRKTNNAITIRHLLSHTSGIPHYMSKLEAMSFTNYATSENVLDFIAGKGVVADPGEQYIYSSYGYAVLGAIIESVSNQSYESYLQTHIWKKSGMNNTSLEKEHDIQKKSRLYIKAGSYFVRGPKTDLSLIYAAGGVQSTTEDLLKFGAAILTNKLVSRETLNVMIDASNSLSPSVGDDPYGLGWYVLDDPNVGKIILHTGAQPGASSYLKIYLDKGIVAATLSNAFGTKGSVLDISREIENLIL